ncbi:MAG: M56 family metallopeptidase [Planctomycetota bacterium]
MNDFLWIGESDVLALAGWTLLHFLWQGLLIAVGTYLVLRLILNESSSESRYGVMCLALALMAASPLLTSAYLFQEIDSEPGKPDHEIAGSDIEVSKIEPLLDMESSQLQESDLVVLSTVPTQHSASDPASNQAGASSRHSVPATPKGSQWITGMLQQIAPWLAGIWIAGVIILSFRLLVAWVRVQIIKCRGHVISEAQHPSGSFLNRYRDPSTGPPPHHQPRRSLDLIAELKQQLGITSAIGLMESALVEVPTVIGWLRPVVLLPASAITGLSQSQLKAVLAHELAHIRRADYLINLIQSLVETILFYHPCIWWLSTQIRIERENCCDDRAAEVCGNPKDYAAALLKLESYRSVHSLAMSAQGAGLLNRISRLVQPRQKDHVAARISPPGIVAVLFLGAITVAMSAILVAATPSSQQETRVLSFPENRSVGVLWIRNAPDEFDYENWYPGIFSGPGSGMPAIEEINPSQWKRVGQACGEVEIEKGQQAHLAVSKSAHRTLSFLTRLDPDSLYSISFQDSEVNDDSLNFIGRLTGLEELDLKNCDISDVGLPRLSELKKLKVINVSTYNGANDGSEISDDGLATLLEQHPQLEEINAVGTAITDVGLTLLAGHSNIRRINFEQTAITDQGIIALDGLELESLYLGSDLSPVGGGQSSITDASMPVIGNMEHLRHLSLRHLPITDNALAELEALEVLKKLTLDGTQVTNSGLRHLSGMPALTMVRHSGQFTFSNEGLRSLSRCPALASIVGNMQYDENTVDVLTTFPALESIQLSGPGVTNDALKKIASMKQLKNIGISNAPVDDRGIEHLASLPDLEIVTAYGTGVVGHGFAALKESRVYFVGFSNSTLDRNRVCDLSGIAQLPELRSLLFESGGGTITGLDKLSEHRKLASFSAQGTSFNSEQVEQISQIKTLQWLFITTSINDDQMHLIAGLPELNRLVMRGNFSDLGLTYLSNCRKLEFLRLYSPNISGEGQSRLVEQLPRLSVGSTSSRQQISTSDNDDIRRYGAEHQRARQDALEGQPPVALRLDQIVNANADLQWDDLKGEVVLVNFWGTWCEPSMAALPTLQNLHERFADRGFEIVSIHTTAGAESLSTLVESSDYGWILASDADNHMSKGFAPAAYPSYSLIDRNGILRFSGVYTDDLEFAIETLLNE